MNRARREQLRAEGRLVSTYIPSGKPKSTYVVIGLAEDEPTVFYVGRGEDDRPRWTERQSLACYFATKRAAENRAVELNAEACDRRRCRAGRAR